jgi:uncharacterized repeat protein (TIGR01451 family)
MSVTFSNTNVPFPNGINFLKLLFFALLFYFSLQHASALTPGGVTITNKSGPSFILDSNNPCAVGPNVSYVAYRVCNTSGATLTNVAVTLSGLSTGFSMMGGQPATQVGGTFSAGQCKTFFWYIRYPCTSNQTTNITITVADSNPGVVNATNQVTTTGIISAAAGGRLVGLTQGPELVEGSSTYFDIEYEFGNIPKDKFAYFQPAGNLTFNAGCLQLTSLEVLTSSIPNTIPVGNSGTLFFVAPQAAGGGEHLVKVRYHFNVNCSNFTTTLIPFAAATSGSQMKYSSNYSAVVVNLTEFQPITNCDGNYDDFATQIIGTNSGLEVSGDNWSTSWGDYDGDGFQDLFLTSYHADQPNELYHNNANGTFSKVNAAPFSMDKATSVAAAWADYDNDGDLDIYVGNNIGAPNFLYRNEGSGNFTKILNDPVVEYEGYSHGVSWADYDNDGFLDLFVATYWETAFNLLYHNNGNGTFSQVTNNPIANEAANSVTGLWADYDNDGWIDLFVANGGTRKNSLYKNMGNGQFQKITTGAIVNDVGDSVGASWGDYNNDGFLDLFVANAANEANFLYKNNGNGTFTKVTTGSIVTDKGHTHGSTWSDFDNDGDLDLFVANDGQNNAIYRNNGNETFTKLSNNISSDGGLSFGSAAADYDRDGDVDLFVANRLGTQNFLYENTKGNCNNWSCIKLTGTKSNKSAIGTKVFVHSKIGGVARRQMREVSSQTGGGTGGQNSMILNFGLGDANIIDSVVVKWPSGYRQVSFNRSVNLYLTITEDSASEVCGTVHYDTNNNCMKDNGEAGIPNAKIVLQPGNITTYTDQEGQYSVFVKTGVYTVQLVPEGAWSAVCPNPQGTRTVNVAALGNKYCGNDFASTTSCALPDLYTEVAITAHRISSQNLMVVNYENKGATRATGAILTVNLPSQIQLLNSSLPYQSFTGNTLTWQLGELSIGEKGAIYLTYNVLTGTQIGMNLQITSNLTANEEDCNTTNDRFTEMSMAVASFDPNDILVSPQRFVREGEWLKYKIRFQNVGNLPAALVQVEDVVPDELDLSTLEMGTASHTFKFQADENKLIWTFPNINLPDSISNEPASHGFLTFRIKLKKGLELGTKIKNEAAIYFDAHEPIRTNTVENILVAEPVDHYVAQASPLVVYPNPTAGKFTVQSPDLNLDQAAYFVEISLMDFLGKPVFTEANLNHQKASFEVFDMPTGTYVLKAVDNLGRVYLGKVIFAKP